MLILVDSQQPAHLIDGAPDLVFPAGDVVMQQPTNAGAGDDFLQVCPMFSKNYAHVRYSGLHRILTLGAVKNFCEGSVIIFKNVKFVEFADEKYFCLKLKKVINFSKLRFLRGLKIFCSNYCIQMIIIN